MKCPKGRIKKRVSLHRGHPSNYARSLKGHTWKGHGKDRRCEKCGAKPRHLLSGIH